jgi:hypothetical protein
MSGFKIAFRRSSGKLPLGNQYHGSQSDRCHLENPDKLCGDPLFIASTIVLCLLDISQAFSYMKAFETFLICKAICFSRTVLDMTSNWPLRYVL